MKFLISSVAALIVGACTLSAVEVSLGPTIAARGTINTVDPGNGLKTGFGINSMPDLGLTTRVMFAEDASIGFVLDIDATGYSYIMRPENEDLANDANTFRTKHSCITISPSLYFSGLQLGIGYSMFSGLEGKTIDGNQTWEPGTQASSVLEARVGAMIPVMRGKTGDLNIVLRASYMLGGHYTTDVQTYPVAPNTTNPQSAGVSFGFNYIFHVVK